MPAYWLECEHCDNKYEFKDITSTRGIVHFIRDVMIPSDWDQRNLTKQCPVCKDGKIRITYEFPTKDKETIRVIHMIGLGNRETPYIPMMWETRPYPYTDCVWFDFKYINKRSAFGLNKPAVLEEKDLRAIFRIYCEKTGKTKFP